MSWKEELKEALILYVAQHGELVKESAVSSGWGRGQYSGFNDFSGNETHRAGGQYDSITLAEHVTECTLDLGRSSYLDTDWYEFDGTFAEEPWGRRQGTDVVVYCTCGRVKGRHWRYTGGLADLIKAVTS